MHALARVAAVCAIAFGMLDVQPAHAAADGYFDPAWVGGGRTTFFGDPAHPSYSAYVQSPIAESNGNILAGGLLISSPYVSWWMAELTPDGNLNSSFGIDTGPPYYYPGRVNGCQIGLSCNDASYGFSAFARQTDDKVLVLSALHLARTNASASAFDTGGVIGGTGSVAASTIAINTGTGYVAPLAMALQNDGKLLLAGSGYSSSADAAAKFGLVRLNSDLSLDKTFNSVGINPPSWGVLLRVDAADSSETVISVLLQPDGHVVLVGYGTKAAVNYLDVARVASDGTPDALFGTGGVAELAVPVAISGSTGATLDRAGRIVVALTRSDTGGVVVARVGTNGQIDPTFGSTGFFLLSAAAASCTTAAACGVAVDSAGRIVASGSCDNQFLVERIRGDTGALDLSFGSGGISHGIFAIGSTHDNACAVTFDPASHLFVAGSSMPAAVTLPGVARLTYDLVYNNNFETLPRGCLPPDCN